MNMLLLLGWAFDLLLFVVGKSWSPIATQTATRQLRGMGCSRKVLRGPWQSADDVLTDD